MYHLAAVGQRQADKLIGQLARIASASAVDDLAVSRIGNDARRLMSADAVGAHTVLGGLAALRWDEAAVREHYRVALGLDGSSTVHYNHSVSLALIERRGDASDAADAALAVAPDDPQVLGHAIEFALEAARFGHARDLCDRWDGLVPDRALPAAGIVRDLAQAVANGAFQESRVAAVLDIAGDIQRQARAHSFGSSIVRDDIPDSFMLKRRINATTTAAVDLTVQLVGRLMSDPCLMQDPGLGFVQMFSGAASDVRDA